MRTLSAVSLVLLLVACGPTAPDIEPHAAEAVAAYAVRLPEGYDPGESYPLVVVLHGYDRTETQPAALWDAGFFFMPDFILLAVRAPFEAGVGYSWFRQAGEDVDPSSRRQSARTAEETVLAALAELEEQYRIDADQRLLVGLGQGADAAAWVTLRHSDLFDGVALLGTVDIGLLAGIPGADELEVFVAGAGDRAREAERFFREAGAETRFFELPGPAVSAAALRAMQNLFDLAEETAPEDNLGYDEEGEPVPGERLQPADWGDEPGTGVAVQEAPEQAGVPR